MSIDFTLNKYKEIVSAISKSEYKVFTVSDYLSSKDLPDRLIIIRHDVDIDSEYQKKFAEMEHNMGIHTSFYYRYIDKVYNKDNIDFVHALGHEVGYHYEVFTKTKGSETEAIKLFKEELGIFQNNWGCKTVCPHGGSFIEDVDGYNLINIITLIPKLLSRRNVFSSWSNFDFWKKNKFEDFQIIGDAYASIDFSDLLYLSDTGRSWDNRFKRLDKVDSKFNERYSIRRSDDVIEIIKKGEVKRIYLLVHFEQWKDNMLDWISWYLAQLIRRYGKKMIFKMK